MITTEVSRTWPTCIYIEVISVKGKNRRRLLPELSLKGNVYIFIPGRLGSASSNSSCGSAEYVGEVIPHHPGMNKVLFISLYFIYFFNLRE